MHTRARECLCRSAHQCVRMLKGVHAGAWEQLCVHKCVGAPVRVHTGPSGDWSVHTGAWEHPCAGVQSSCGGSQLTRRPDGGAEDGRPTGMAPFRVPYGEPCGRRRVHLRTVGVEGGSCGYSMRYWVLLPLWGRKGGRGCPALGLRLPLAVPGYTWQDCHGALQMPSHQALGL